MKIYSNRPPENQDITLMVQKSVKPEPAQDSGSAAAKTVATDRVDLSGEAKKMAELKGMINQLPDIRTDKVDAVAKTIAEGTYNVDAKQVAVKMLSEFI